MNRQTESRGKIFTDVIRKTPVKAEICTHDALIRGTIHVHPDRRVSDELNADELFLAVTDAQIRDSDGDRSIPFIAVNKRNIYWVIPQEDQG